MPVLVLAEHNDQHINSATLKTIAAARKIDADVHLLMLGHQMDGAVAEAAKIHGITKVIVADDAVLAHHLAENMAPVIVDMAGAYSHILAPATSTGKNVMPRVAALLDVQQISDITGVVSPDTFNRPAYAGNAILTVQSTDAKKVITVRTTAFDPVKAEGGQPPVEKISAKGDFGRSKFVSIEAAKSDRPELTSARIVVSGGRGVGSKENFALITALADKMKAAVGASRAAVDAGFAPNDWQVGQTGKIVAPELYVAVGISGAIQHLAGMKDSKVIVAINKDPDAPVFQVADYGLVGDLFQIVPELTAKL